MNICVTGGASFIGLHLVNRLIDNRHTVLVIDNLSSGNKDSLILKLSLLKWILEIQI
ncbi:NAD-dependent epimerase/dehydratase family protein [Veillonella atypica]|jgi:UDP-glucose 4-epimerase|uniref:NAD-dependent epimerase/dehydratase family protein n=1 Tax=Veillonella atypica TaxID=39777 RepID=UPI003AF0614B